MRPFVNCYDSDLVTSGLQMELNWSEEFISISCETFLMNLSSFGRYYSED